MIQDVNTIDDLSKVIENFISSKNQYIEPEPGDIFSKAAAMQFLYAYARPPTVVGESTIDQSIVSEREILVSF